MKCFYYELRVSVPLGHPEALNYGKIFKEISGILKSTLNMSSIVNAYARVRVGVRVCVCVCVCVCRCVCVGA
jgi:hypothetical protein